MDWLPLRLVNDFFFVELLAVIFNYDNSGHAKGVADHNRFAPIWRDWSAEVQVNIHRKHVPSEHAVLLPGYFLYTSPLSVHPHLPHTHALDNVASESAEVEAAAQSSSSGAIDGVSACDL